MENQRFVNCSTVPFVVCAGAQNYSRDVSQLNLHSSHHQNCTQFGDGRNGGLDEYCTIFLRRMSVRIQVTANREDKRKMFFILIGQRGVSHTPEFSP
jgi:hypothetical protein